jgi:hypothetical protein
MVANYRFIPTSLELIAPSFSNTNFTNIRGITSIPHPTDSEQLLFAIPDFGGAPRLWKRGTDATPFQFNGTSGTDYFTRSFTNWGLGSGSASNVAHWVPGSSTANDLLVVCASSGTASSNTLSFIRRGSDASPFPGAATADGVDRWQTTNANIGGIALTRALCYIPHPTDSEDDLIAITFDSATAASQLIRRGSGDPFPGASTADGVDRWARTKTNWTGNSSSSIQGMCFIKHPTDSAQDLLAILNRTSGRCWLIERGSNDSDPFPGGVGNRFLIDISVSMAAGYSCYPNVIYNQESPLADALVFGGSNTGVFYVLFRQSLNNDEAFLDTQNYITITSGGTSTSIAPFIDTSNRSNDFFVMMFGAFAYRIYSSASIEFQPLATQSYLLFSSENGSILVNTNGIALTSSTDIFTLDKTVSGLGDLWGRGYWTRNTESNFELAADFDFQGTSTLTGDYSLDITGAVTLGSRTTYNESITLTSAATLILNQDVELTEDFVLSAGTTVEADDNTGPYTLTIPYADPGLVLGTGVTIAAPTPTVTITGLIAGSEVRIYEANTATEIAGIESSSTTFAFEGGAGDFYDIEILSLGYKNIFIEDYEFPTADGTLPVSQSVERDYLNP